MAKTSKPEFTSATRDDLIRGAIQKDKLRDFAAISKAVTDKAKAEYGLSPQQVGIRKGLVRRVAEELGVSVSGLEGDSREVRQSGGDSELTAKDLRQAGCRRSKRGIRTRNSMWWGEIPRPNCYV